MKINAKINSKNPYICAKSGKQFKVETNGNKIIFIAPKNSLDFNTCRIISTQLLKLKEKSITFDLSSFLDVMIPECRFSAIVSLLSKIDTFNEPQFSLKTKQVKYEANIIVKQKDVNDVKNALKVLEGIHLATYLQLLPANYLGIADFANFVKSKLSALKNKHLKVKILDLAQIKKEKMELLQAVNSGSDEPAKMLVVEYLNSPSKDVLGFIGKGVTFDSGGYEIKPYTAMFDMNQDMTGAATVFGTIYALANTNAKVNVVGFMPLAKNLINEHSMLVTDVYKACNGRTVEIIAPDAEGRLILADAIAYANKHYKLSKIMTIATLTGLSHISYGDFLTPCWVTKSSTAKEITDASILSLEHVLCMPFYDEYSELVNNSSKIADCSNNCSSREASNATAAAFLRLFSKCDDFAHFDIAGSNVFKKHIWNPLGLMLFLLSMGHFNKF